jgi:hypothetical protein
VGRNSFHVHIPGILLPSPSPSQKVDNPVFDVYSPIFKVFLLFGGNQNEKWEKSSISDTRSLMLDTGCLEKTALRG